MNKLLAALAATAALLATWMPGTAGAQSARALSGQVLEAQDAGIYTYIRLKTATGEAWAAVNKAAVKKGETVTIGNPMEMRNFESKSLNRTFDRIVFGTLAAGAGAGAAPAPAAAAAGAAPAAAGAAPPAAAAPPKGAGGNLGEVHGNVAKAPDPGVISVAKAEGRSGRTVAEVNAQRTALKGKQVAVRAKVIKVSSGILGRNWIHLRDGSGSAADNTHDLLVTSKDKPQVGDVVLAKGVVMTDVKLGEGYAYKVLIENASFQK